MSQALWTRTVNLPAVGRNHAKLIVKLPSSRKKTNIGNVLESVHTRGETGMLSFLCPPAD